MQASNVSEASNWLLAYARQLSWAILAPLSEYNFIVISSAVDVPLEKRRRFQHKPLDRHHLRPKQVNDRDLLRLFGAKPFQV